MFKRYFSSTVVVNSLKDTRIFNPITVGRNKLEHGIVHSPMTRVRSPSDGVPTNLQLQYYDERTRIPGTLVTTEALVLCEETGHVGPPGIYSERQTNGWKQIVDKVHENGSFITAQLWHLGNTGDPGYLKNKGLEFKGVSAVYPSEQAKEKAEKAENPIKEYTEDDIKDLIYNKYTTAAKNALAAGFDYVELHHGNGYLLEQFLYPHTNRRTDKYGGSIENRSRFLLELIDQLLPIVGADKLAIRMNPYVQLPGMLGFDEEIHPMVPNAYIVSHLQKLAEKGNELAYIHLVNSAIKMDGSPPTKFDFSWFEDLWKGKIIRGGCNSDDLDFAETLVKDDRTLLGFGRAFLANPDLPNKLKNDQPLNAPDFTTFYGYHNWGYNTYPKYSEVSDYEESVERKNVGVPLA